MTKVSGEYTAVVTGAGSGIGRALALALAAEGARVVVADILAKDATSVAGEIAAAGGEAIAAECDVSDRAALRELKARANAAYGPVSHLFANAGVTSFESMDGISDEEIDWVLEVNLLGVISSLQIFMPDMMGQRRGHFVATSSLSGLIPSLVPDHLPYAASKSGIIASVLNLRPLLARFGIGATVLCPGPVDTQVMRSPRSRPARFGGASDTIFVPSVEIDPGKYKSAEEVARQTLEAVRANQPLVITDPSLRQAFLEQFVGPVLQAFDCAESAEHPSRALRTPGE